MLQFSAETGLTVFVVCFFTGVTLILLGRFAPLASRSLTAVDKRPEVPLAEQFELASPGPPRRPGAFRVDRAPFSAHAFCGRSSYC
ncbi:hypothetical protein N7470_008090 [Penicillium chermesinum]|nr:hypothetical protein N7470_008090 [Penicillium chermesinum]